MDAYLLDLEVDELPGVGWNLCHKLKELGIASVRDVRGSSKDVLQRELGRKTGGLLSLSSCCEAFAASAPVAGHQHCGL